jgi:hypothetical protein
MRRLIALFLAPLLGLAAFTARGLSDWPEPHNLRSFIGVVAKAAESVSLPEFLLFALCGLVLGLVAGPRRNVGNVRNAMPVALGLAAVCALPVFSVLDLELGVSGSPHSLLPIEWLFYLAYGLIVFVGVVAAQRRITPSQVTIET